jgi:RHS repeat-associated protein
VLVSGSEVARFVYDAEGQRRRKIAGGVTRDYIIDDDHGVEERLSGGLSGTVRYFPGTEIDGWLGRVGATGATTYFLADHLGSVVRQTDAAGVPTLTRTYDAWGRLDATSAGIGGPAYTGREWDPETALYYYRSRYYSPALGRFISEDPAGLGGGTNLLAYVENRPTVATDPFGLAPGAGGGLKPKWRQCNPVEYAACEVICGEKGVESCMFRQTFRLVRGTDRNGNWFEVYKWVDAPMSCSCNDPDEDPDAKFCRQNPATCVTILILGVLMCFRPGMGGRVPAAQPAI